MANYGLRNTANGEQVPLKNIEIKVFIKGFVANVEANLTYKNEEYDPIEALFTFPVDESSAVYKFEAEIENRLVVGECQEKKQAEQTYQDALAAGRSAFLLKESDASRDVFECSVGNLPPQTEAVIKFAYVLELTLEGDGAVRFSYPAVLVQRYGVPGKPLMQASTSATDPSRAGLSVPTLSHTDTLPYTVSFDVMVETNHSVQDIQAEDKLANLSISYSRDRKTAEVSLVDGFSFDHDLILYVWYSSQRDPHVIHERGDTEKDGFLKRDMVMLNFFPKDVCQPETDNVGRGEFIFIVDRSGSMGGDRILSAKAALKTFLEHLPSDCYFNVISFGSSFSALFQQKSLRNNKKNRERAVRLQHNLRADMGGTEMIRPFEFVYDQPSIQGYSRQVLLLTDGGIWNGTQLIDMVRKNSHTTRVFTFGIGSGASTWLVKGVARAGRGRPQFITDELDRLPVKVEQVMRCATQPSVDDVSIDWTLPPGVKVTTLPSKVPAVFQDECLIIYGMLTGTEKCHKNDKIQAALTGKICGKDFCSSVQLKLADGSSGSEDLMIHRLAAKAQIKEMEDEEVNDDRKTNIVLLSTSANIVSKHTAFVGVDKDRLQRVEGEMQKRRVPLAQERSAAARGRHHRSGQSSLRWRSGGRGGCGGGRGGGSSGVGGPSNTLSNQQSNLSGLYGAGASHSVAMAASMPVLTGGGSSSSPLADKYISGKTVTSISLSDSEAEETSGKTQGKSAIKRKKRSKLFVQKKHKQECDVKRQMFAPWHDGTFYPVNKILDARSGHRVKTQFRDGLEAWVRVRDLLSAVQLSSGDVVGVKDGHSYVKSVVLEYCGQSDNIVVARCDGVVIKDKPVHFNIPRETAQNMKSRQAGSFEPTSLSQFLGQTGLVTMTTSDVAELTGDGWLTERLVEYWFSYFWRTLSETDRQRAVFFSPWFYSKLGMPVESEQRLTRHQDLIQRQEGTKPWTNFIDLRRTEAVFVPVFDETHWYLIFVKLYPLGSEAINQYGGYFIIMDSYYTADREEETSQIKQFLATEANRQGVRIQFEGRIRKAASPVQYNESDCGVCMMLCVKQCFKDDLVPRPHLDWFDNTTTADFRKELCHQIMIEWDMQ